MVRPVPRRESVGMTFPTVTEITPRPEAVTPDPFIATLPRRDRRDVTWSRAS